MSYGDYMGKQSVRNTALRENVRSLDREHMTNAEIGRVLGVSGERVRQIRAELGLKTIKCRCGRSLLKGERTLCRECAEKEAGPKLVPCANGCGRLSQAAISDVCSRCRFHNYDVMAPEIKERYRKRARDWYHAHKGKDKRQGQRDKERSRS